MKSRLSYTLATVAALVTGLSAMAQTTKTNYVLDKADEIRLAINVTSNVYELSGPGLKLTFEAYKNARTAINQLYVHTSVDNKTWKEKVYKIEAGDLNYNSYKEFTFDIDSNVRYIKFNNVGSYSRYVRNVKVTRATTLTSSATSIDFGTTDPGVPVSRTISVDFNNTYSDAILKGTCTNAAFTVTQRSMGATGTAEITVTYNPGKAGSDTGRVTLSMGTAGKNNNVTYSFDVSGKSRLHLYPSNTGSYQSGNVPGVVLHRTLPAGYSTIALPFDTSIEQITGNGNDKVFTLCNVSYTVAEGYTFYFTEVEGGVIAAGQPYVIFLNAEVNTPSWENITCGELSAVTISRGGWDFVSNFQANTSMTGKYGVVNSKNKIMKGGAGATLNAFTAYFRLNARTKASVHDSTIPAGAIPLFSVTVRP